MKCSICKKRKGNEGSMKFPLCERCYKTKFKKSYHDYMKWLTEQSEGAKKIK